MSKILSDDSAYSRVFLGEGIRGSQFADNASVARASDMMLRKLWEHHAPILRHLGAVKPEFRA